MKADLKFKKFISGFLILALLHLCWVSSFAWAERVVTDALVPAQTEIQNPRQRLMALINREDVAAQLQQHGISKVEAVARINSLTDAEVREITGKLGQLPPGGYYAGAFVAGLMILAMIVLAPGVVCAIREPYCLIFDCEKRWKACVKSIFSYPGGDWNGRGVGKLNQQICQFDCDEALKVCFESISEGEDAMPGKLQCEKEMEMCFQQCDGRE